MDAHDDDRLVSCLIRRINAVAQLVHPEDLGIVFVGTPRRSSQLHALQRIRETAKKWKARNELSTVTFFVRFDGKSSRDFPSPSQEISIGTAADDRFCPQVSLRCATALMVLLILLAIVWKRVFRF